MLCQGCRAEWWRNNLSMNEAWTSEHQRRISLLVFHLQPLMGTVCRSGGEVCLAARSWCAWLGCGPDLGRTGCLQPRSICDRKLWEPLCAHKCLLCSSPLFWYLTDEVLQFFFSWKWHRISFLFLIYFLYFLPGKEIQKTWFSRAKAIPVVWHLNLFQSKKGLPSPLGLVRILPDLSIQTERNIVRTVNLGGFLQMHPALFFWFKYGFYHANFFWVINVRDFQYALNFVLHW